MRPQARMMQLSEEVSRLEVECEQLRLARGERDAARLAQQRISVLQEDVRALQVDNESLALQSATDRELARSAQAKVSQLHNDLADLRGEYEHLRINAIDANTNMASVSS